MGLKWVLATVGKVGLVFMGAKNPRDSSENAETTGGAMTILSDPKHQRIIFLPMSSILNK